MYSKCNCCTKVLEKRALPDKTGFLNIFNNIKKSFSTDKGNVKLEKKEIAFRIFNEPGMELNPRIHIIEVLAIMNEPYSIHVYSYNHSLKRINHVCSPDILHVSKVLNCYSNTIKDVKSEELTPLKKFINGNLIL